MRKMAMQKRFATIEPVSGLRTAVVGILFDAEDFELLKPHRWRLTKDGYVITSHPVNRQTSIYMQRMLITPPEGMQIDHKNGNKLDNRRCNLRVCTRSQNLCNMDRHAGKRKSKYKGAYLMKNGKYRSTIRIPEKSIFLGEFATAEEAAAAYNTAALIYHGEFAYLNILTINPVPTDQTTKEEV